MTVFDDPTADPTAFLAAIDLDAPPALGEDRDDLEPWEIQANWRARVRHEIIESPGLPEETAARFGVADDDARELAADLFGLWFRRHVGNKAWREAYGIGPAVHPPVPAPPVRAMPPRARARTRRIRCGRRASRARSPGRPDRLEDDPGPPDAPPKGAA